MTPEKRAEKPENKVKSTNYQSIKKEKNLKMKMFRILMGALALAMVAATVTGCKKEKETASEVVASKENEFSKHLLKEIAKASTDDIFRNQVYKMVNYRFDGDDNVLCKELQNANREIQDLDFDIATALNYFQNEGRYPQIYIPFFDENEKTRGQENIIFVNAINVDESQLALQGYYWDGESLAPTDFMVDEEYAENHEVWVLSINERVDENGNPLFSFEMEGDNGENGGKGYSRTGIKHEYITRIKCTNLNQIESWFYGAPELRCDCVSGSSTKVSTQFFYPENRSDINEKYWCVNCNYGRKMYYWNHSLITKYVFFQWTEIDNSGASVSFPISFSIAGIVNAGVTITLKADDKNAGGYAVCYDESYGEDSPYITGNIEWCDEYR